VLTPDRLARKYAYQVLLLEELRRAGCAVVFLHHPISDDPNDRNCSRSPIRSSASGCRLRGELR
jgi:DNA invertase Pin-like site-specific DNA recombinase